MKLKYRLLMAGGVSLLFLAMVFWKINIYFETNDDRMVTEVLAGTTVMKPDAHVVYMNYLLAFPLTLLYGITSKVPWYGGMLILFHLLVYFFLLESVYSRCGKAVEVIVGTVIIGCFFLLNLYMTALIQYTSTAALLAGAGYACLLVKKDRREGIAEFFVLELLSFFLRRQAMLMIQPIGAVTVLAFYLVEQGVLFRKKVRKITGWAVAVGAVFLIGFLGTGIAYGGQEWKDYFRFHEARVELFDYYGKPAYDDVKAILDKYQVSEIEYEGFCNHVFLDGDISPDCAEELVTYVREQDERALNGKEILGQAYRKFASSDSMKIQYVVILLWMAVPIWILLARRKHLLLPWLGLSGVSVLLWGYMIYKGRTPYRVMLPILTCVALLFMVLLFLEFVTQSRKAKVQQKVLLRVHTVFGLGIGMLLVMCSLGAAKTQYALARQHNQGQSIFMEGMRTIQEYCLNNEEKRYILDMTAFGHYKGSALETGIYGERNSVDTGSWYANSPVMRQSLKAYLEGQEDNLYLITNEDDRQEKHPAVRYLAEKLQKTPVIADRVVVDGIGNYLVWHFQEGL